LAVVVGVDVEDSGELVVVLFVGEEVVEPLGDAVVGALVVDGATMVALLSLLVGAAVVGAAVGGTAVTGSATDSVKDASMTGLGVIQGAQLKSTNRTRMERSLPIQSK
jgi:hypothetical protein